MAADSSGELLASLLGHVAPQLTRQDLAPLSNSPVLVNALLQLLKTHGGPEGERERLVAEQKVASLRTSLSHLTAHLNLLSNRLAASESTLSSLKLLKGQQLTRVAEERDGLRGLCGVWEGRWREERRLREAEEGAGRAAAGRALNDRPSRMETSFTLLKPITPAVSRSRRSSSASSSSSSSDVTHLTTSHSPRKRHGSSPVLVASSSTSTPRLRTRQIVADLARELERVRREADRLLFERDEEITRLEAEQSLRRREMAELYGSLDTLLGLAGRVDLRAPTALEDVPLPPDSPAPGVRPPPALNKGKGKAHVRLGSILDLPAVRAAAAHSRSNGETMALEEEVRELEREIARMSAGDLGAPQSSSAGEDVTSGSELPPARYEEHHDLRLTIQELNAQVAQLRNDLEEARHERSALKRLYEEHSGDRERAPFDPCPPPPQPRQSYSPDLTQELEAEVDRLSHLLANSEASNAALSAQFEEVSERVRMKLLEQKRKLEACYREMEALGNALEESERRVEGERARRKEAEGRLRELELGM